MAVHPAKFREGPADGRHRQQGPPCTGWGCRPPRAAGSPGWPPAPPPTCPPGARWRQRPPQRGKIFQTPGPGSRASPRKSWRPAPGPCERRGRKGPPPPGNEFAGLLSLPPITPPQPKNYGNRSMRLVTGLYLPPGKYPVTSRQGVPVVFPMERGGCGPLEGKPAGRWRRGPEKSYGNKRGLCRGGHFRLTFSPTGSIITENKRETCDRERGRGAPPFSRESPGLGRRQGGAPMEPGRAGRKWPDVFPR